MSFSMRPEWRRWLLPQGKLDKEIIKANMIIAVKPQNMWEVPEVILLLGTIWVMVALLPKETP